MTVLSLGSVCMCKCARAYDSSVFGGCVCVCVCVFHLSDWYSCYLL